MENSLLVDTWLWVCKTRAMSAKTYLFIWRIFKYSFRELLSWVDHSDLGHSLSPALTPGWTWDPWHIPVSRSVSSCIPCYSPWRAPGPGSFTLCIRGSFWSKLLAAGSASPDQGPWGGALVMGAWPVLGSAAALGSPAFNEQQALAAPWPSCITLSSNILQLMHIPSQGVSKYSSTHQLIDYPPWSYPASPCKLLVNIWPNCWPQTDPQQVSEHKSLTKSHKHLKGKINSKP